MAIIQPTMSILAFTKDLIIATFGQMVSLFGGIVIFGLLIHFISQLTFKSLERSFGRGGTYFVAWLGTPIHELGHAVFCLIFMHKIVEIEFFKPDPITGTLGYVYHKWNRSNPWQVLGNFFIGVGPVVLGCVVLLGIFYFLIPNSSQVWDTISTRLSEIDQNHSIGGYFTILGDSALNMTRLVFTVSNLASWRFWFFCYLSICVASNIRLSLSDIKGSLSGLGCVVLPFLLINFLGLTTGFGSEKFFSFTASSLGMVYSLLILALVMVLLGFILTYLVSAAFVKLRRGYILNPF
ncbi:hypothetical protein ACFLWC_07710 [Chloroflexota bacterium]